MDDTNLWWRLADFPSCQPQPSAPTLNTTSRSWAKIWQQGRSRSQKEREKSHRDRAQRGDKQFEPRVYDAPMTRNELGETTRRWEAAVGAEHKDARVREVLAKQRRET